MEGGRHNLGLILEWSKDEDGSRKILDHIYNDPSSSGMMNEGYCRQGCHHHLSK